MRRNILALILLSSVSPAATIHGRVVNAKSGELSDGSGEFQVAGVEPGAYTVTAEHSGFIVDPESRRSIVNVSSDEKAEITIKLIPPRRSPGACSTKMAIRRPEPAFRSSR